MREIRGGEEREESREMGERERERLGGRWGEKAEREREDGVGEREDEDMSGGERKRRDVREDDRGGADCGVVRKRSGFLCVARAPLLGALWCASSLSSLVCASVSLSAFLRHSKARDTF